MRIGLFSDVHGNAIALAAALDDLARQGLDTLVCLGDHVQGGAQPAESLERLRELGCRVVLRNADQEVLTPSRDVEEWTFAQLTSEQVDFVRTFEPTVEVDLGDGAHLVCFHGSPRSFDEVVLPQTPLEELRAATGGSDAEVLAGGHVHLQWLRRFDSSFWLCAGSVGFAYAHDQPSEPVRLDSFAEYAVVTSEEGRLGVEFRRTPYDGEEYVRALLASGRPGAEEVARGWAR